VARVGADDVDLAVAADDLAVFADTLDTRSHFHEFSIASNGVRPEAPAAIMIPKMISSRPKPNLANIVGRLPFRKSGADKCV